MPYRILVDENTSPRVADRLRSNGHEAKHVNETVGDGTSDRAIVEFAAENGYAVLTADTDFLHPEHRRSVRVIYYGDGDLTVTEIVETIDRLSRIVPEQSELPRPTSLTAWR